MVEQNDDEFASKFTAEEENDDHKDEEFLPTSDSPEENEKDGEQKPDASKVPDDVLFAKVVSPNGLVSSTSSTSKPLPPAPSVDEMKKLIAPVASPKSDPPGDTKNPKTPDLVPEDEDGEFHALDQEDDGMFSIEQQLYLKKTTYAKVLIDYLATVSGRDAIRPLRHILSDNSKVHSLITALRMIAVCSDDISEVVNNKENFNDDDFYTALPNCVIDAALVHSKAVENQASSSVNLYSYSVVPEHLQALGGDIGTLTDPTDGLPVPAMVSRLGDATVHYSSMDNMAMLAGYMAVSVTGKSKQNVVSEPAYTEIISKLKLLKLSVKTYPRYDYKNYSKFVDALKPAYKTANNIATPLTKVKKFDLPKLVVSALKLIGPSIGSWTQYSATAQRAEVGDLPKVSFTMVDLEKARAFRKNESIKKLCKEPYDKYSLKFAAVSTVRKFLYPLLDINHVAERIVSVGHSKKNNWQAMLKNFGAVLHPDDVTLLAPAKALEMADRKPWLTGKTTEPWDGFLKIDNSVAATPKVNVLISDVHISRKQKNAQFKFQLMAYLRHLELYLQKGWVVIAKFTPTHCDDFDPKGMFDWDKYWPIFSNCNVLPYYGSRLHNGEVVLMISRKQVVKGQSVYGREQWMALSAHMQSRMYIGNYVRNYGLCWGMSVLNQVQPLSTFALKLLPDNVINQYIKAMGKAGEDESKLFLKENYLEELKAENDKKEANRKLAKEKVLDSAVSSATKNYGSTPTNRLSRLAALDIKK